eukprot:TRINITY_DN5598_c0_g1_i1.p1 TRINITY_DN5598_c0_g1~~TRINITY_DN5598_c0_g1_i1.p1  ORF type:complete len:668 (+),score=126.48 TRINITY_DN5598_c0_g1_i1:100-2103(+)
MSVIVVDDIEEENAHAQVVPEAPNAPLPGGTASAATTRAAVLARQGSVLSAAPPSIVRSLSTLASDIPDEEEPRSRERGSMLSAAPPSVVRGSLLTTATADIPEEEPRSRERGSMLSAAPPSVVRGSLLSTAVEDIEEIPAVAAQSPARISDDLALLLADGVKPYCGAKAIVAAQDTAVGDRMVHGAPAPAWVDASLLDHMRGAIVPSKAWTSPVPQAEGESDLKARPLRAYEPQRFRFGVCAFRLCVAAGTLVETLLGYAAYVETPSPNDNLYNKFEANALSLPGLMPLLLALSAAGSAWCFVVWVLVFVVKLDVYRPALLLRLPCSVLSGGSCMIIVLIGEQTKIFALLCGIAMWLNLQVWLLDRLGYFAPQKQVAVVDDAREAEAKPGKGRMRRLRTAWHWAPLALACLWAALFVFDAVVFFRNSDCVATANRAMPVFVEGLRDLQCVQWKKPHYITRKPAAGVEAYKAYCSTSLHVFDAVDVNGTSVPTSGAHLVMCPPQCQSLGLGTHVVGCYKYSASSSICSAAVQMGVLPPDAGGVVKVVGRPAPQSYSRCNRNGVMSTSSDDSQLMSGSGPWAFYFQVPDLEDNDMIMLHGWRHLGGFSSVTAPWRSYVANVTWSVGGLQQQREVRLGDSNTAGLQLGGIELNFCRSDRVPPSQRTLCP